jgi:putative NADPH-quinone reductase
MSRRITIIQGHPDPSERHLCHALADAYRAGAEEAGFEVRAIEVAQLDFPWISSKADFEHGPRPPAIAEAQSVIRSSDHIVIVYPLWHGTLPALFKAFLEQVFRYDFAFEPGPGGRYRKLLAGRSARIVVTMGMPALAYRWYFGAHGLKSLEQNLLKFAGIRPVRATLLGRVEQVDPTTRTRWIERLQDLGRRGA